MRLAYSGAPDWIKSSPMLCIIPQVKAVSGSTPCWRASRRQMPATSKLCRQKALRSKPGPARNAPVIADASTSVRRVLKPSRMAASSTLVESRKPWKRAELASRNTLAAITGSRSILCASVSISVCGSSN